MSVQSVWRTSKTDRLTLGKRAAMKIARTRAHSKRLRSKPPILMRGGAPEGA
jgi:hypothetical protein